MSQRIISFGIIGGGLIGREFASAAARWFHLTEVDFRPQIVAVCAWEIRELRAAAYHKGRVFANDLQDGLVSGLINPEGFFT